MTNLETDKERLFVLDTNVLMHDPTSIFRFAEHDVYIPMVVLEELDNGKKGLSEVARNVRNYGLRPVSGLQDLATGSPHPRSVFRNCFWMHKYCH